jgi:putative nucleotidyltransferase with HDIG domain
MRKIGNGNKFGSQPILLRVSIILSALGIVAFSLIVPNFLSKESNLVSGSIRGRYQEGSLAPVDIRAKESFYYIDEGQTLKEQESAAKAILPQFEKSEIDTQLAYSKIESIFQNNSDLKEIEAQVNVLSDERKNFVYQLVLKLARRYLTLGIFAEEEINLVTENGYFKVDLDQKEAQLNDIYTLKRVLHELDDEIKIYSSLINSQENHIVYSVLKETLKSNVYYNSQKTEAKRVEAANKVELVTVKIEQGQYLIKKDFVITKSNLKALEAMRLASMKFSFSQNIGRFIFSLIVTIVALYAFIFIFSHTHRTYQYLNLFLLGTLITQLLGYLILYFAIKLPILYLDPFLPFFALPILLTLITNRKLSGFIASLLLGSYALLLPFSNVTTLYFIVAITSAGIYFIRYVFKRVDMIFQWFFSMIWAIGIVLINNLFNGYGFATLVQPLFIIIANISFSYAVVSLLLPLLELIGNFPTSFRLRELAYGDSKILVRLSQVATGTYNHSMQVAELAYVAAKEIGADPLLARVGAMYHDIGKLENPEYFIENQSGDNKHDDLKASLSVAIIKSHVKIGSEKAREGRLPQEVIDIISQHHGNDLIRVFYREAQEAAAEKGEQVNVASQDYSYNNLIPQTPEAAIVMLSDSVEAAARTIKKPNAQKYEKLVNQIIMEKIERKQLSDSRLSLTDLEMITKVFVKYLVGRHHDRIEYPDQQQ